MNSLPYSVELILIRKKTFLFLAFLMKSSFEQRNISRIGSPSPQKFVSPFQTKQ